MNNYCDFTSVILPTESAAAGAAVYNDGIAVVDGFSPFVYLFSFCGSFVNAVPVKRPYRSIYYDCDRQLFVVLSCGCSGAVYVLNCRFEEVGTVVPDRTFGEITDAGIYNREPYVGYLVITYLHSIRIYNFSGEYVDFIKDTNENIMYLDYQSLPTGEAAHYVRNSLEYISITDSGQSYIAALPQYLSLKSLIMRCCGEVYGFFGYRYVYNYLIPLYKDGIFLANTVLDIGNIIESTASDKCCD